MNKSMPYSSQKPCLIRCLNPEITGRDHVEKTAKLIAQINRHLDFLWKMYEKNNKRSACLIIINLLLSLAVTAAGFMKQPELAGFLGLGTTFFIALHKAFSFSEKARIFYSSHSQAKVIRDKLNYKVHNLTDFERFFDEFTALRTSSTENLPTGEGINASAAASKGSS